MKLSEYTCFYKLARKRLASEEDYLKFQRYQGLLLMEFLKERGLSFRGARVLDLGSGIGGYSLALLAEGGRVVSLDLTIPRVAGRELDGRFVVGDATNVPSAEGSFDFVLCSSLIEHVARPSQLLAEIYRVLAVGGICYLSFPPFYSLAGGHQFSPFHLFGERMAINLSRFLGVEIKDWVAESYDIPSSSLFSSYATAYGGWGLHPLKIVGVERMLCQVGFEIQSVTTRFSPVNFARIPVLKEFLTWHVQFLVRKQL